MVNFTFLVVIVLVAFVFVAYLTRNAPVIYGSGPSWGYGPTWGPTWGPGPSFGYGGGPTFVVNDFDGGSSFNE